ncbi:glycosyltransferase [Planktomarina sp.]|nr:glycosyltransferase [Planktomarina sp.]
MKRSPTVSVLMACYNSESTLNGSIKSILNQTFNDFEFIIVDDFSSDATLKIIRKFAKRDSRIIVLRNSENRGLAYSLNFAFSKSTGTLIARMDADDCSISSRLEIQVKHFFENRKLSVLGTSAIYHNESNGAIDVKLVEMPLTHQEIIKYMYKSSPFIHPSVMMSREFFETTGGYEETLRRAQDYDLWLRGREIGVYQNLSQPLLVYRLDIDKSHKAIFQTFILKIKSRPSFREFIIGTVYSIYEVFKVIKIIVFGQLWGRQRKL